LEDVLHITPSEGEALVGTQPAKPEKQLGKIS
jgi:hypothetical protein